MNHDDIKCIRIQKNDVEFLSCIYYLSYNILSVKCYIQCDTSKYARIHRNIWRSFFYRCLWCLIFNQGPYWVFNGPIIIRLVNEKWKNPSGLWKLGTPLNKIKIWKNPSSNMWCALWSHFGMFCNCVDNESDTESTIFVFVLHESPLLLAI